MRYPTSLKSTNSNCENHTKRKAAKTNNKEDKNKRIGK